MRGIKGWNKVGIKGYFFHLELAALSPDTSTSSLCVSSFSASLLIARKS